MNKENLLTVFLAVLVVVSAIQAIQLISLGGALTTGAVVSKPPAASSGATGQATNLPSNLDDLEGMVGGC